MAGKRGGEGRASPRATKVRRADDPAVANARKNALEGELDDTSALRLFLASGDVGKCGRACKGNPKRVDCVCGLVPPRDGFRRSGLWRKDIEAIVTEAVGVNPKTLARPTTTMPCGLRNLGNTCYVNAALQCLFSIGSFTDEVFALDVTSDPNHSESSSGGEGAGEATKGRGGVLDKTHVNSAPDNKKNATAALRELFASMRFGDHKTCDPTVFASALSLETSSQQDGQEFLKLLLAYVDKVAAKNKGNADGQKNSVPPDANTEKPYENTTTFVSSHFCGQYTYATTCTKCGCASESSKKPVDFYELELNVGKPEFGEFRAGATETAGSKQHEKSEKTPFGLRDSLNEFLTVEHLDGDNQYRCETCCSLQDATRAVQIKRVPKYLVCQLKRFVFDFETFERRKNTDAFQFPLEISLDDFLTDEGGMDGMETKSSHNDYELASILLHRGQNATSGHYVALVRDGGVGTGNANVGKTDANANSTDRWWRFDDDVVTGLRGGPFGEAVAVEKTVSGGEANDATDNNNDKGKQRQAKNKPEQPPKVPRDGSTLAPVSYVSSDAYLLVHKRKESGGDRAGDDADDVDAPRTLSTLPSDLLNAVTSKNENLALMAATFEVRREEARAQIDERRKNAREVAETAKAPSVDGEDAGNVHDMDRNALDVNKGMTDTPYKPTDAYRFVPRSWLAAFCDSSFDAGPLDCSQIECQHGCVDPNKAEQVVRISGMAFETIVRSENGNRVQGDMSIGCSTSTQTICRACLRVASSQLAGEDAVVHERTRARERLDRWEKEQKTKSSDVEVDMIVDMTRDRDTTVITEEEMNVSNEKTSNYTFLVSAVWLKKWRSWRGAIPPTAMTKESGTAPITCPHGNLKPNANATKVDRETWSFLVNNPPSKGVTDGSVIELDANSERPSTNQSSDAIDGVHTHGLGGGGGGGAPVTRTPLRTHKNEDDDDMQVTGVLSGWNEEPARTNGGTVFSGKTPSQTWTPFPCHIPECALCVSSKAQGANDKQDLKALVEVHRATCGALRDPFDADEVHAFRANEPEAMSADQAPFRVVPSAWLTKYRAFMFPQTGGMGKQSGVLITKDNTWRPTLHSLRSAVAEMKCTHGLCLCTVASLWRRAAGNDGDLQKSPLLETLRVEKIKTLRAFFGDEGGVKATGIGDNNSYVVKSHKQQHELIPSPVFQQLEEVLSGAVDAPGCFSRESSQNERRVSFLPETCATCVGDTKDTKDTKGQPGVSVKPVSPFFEQKITVRRVKYDLSQTMREYRDRAVAAKVVEKRKGDEKFGGPETMDFTTQEVPIASKTITKGQPHALRGGRVVSSSGGSKKWWEAPKDSTHSAKVNSFPKLEPVGRASPLTIDHDYTVWRVKLLLLEKLGIHPLDQRLFACEVDAVDGTTPVGVVELNNPETLGESQIGPGSKLCLFATDVHDPEDLTGLEMPLGNVGWETDVRGGKAVQAVERGFAGTGLHGVE